VREVAQPQVTRRKFTVDEYHLLARAGILKEDDRVELLDGDIVEMSPIGSRHAACVDRLNRVFSRLGERAIVRVQSPVRLGDLAEPQPDLALLRPRADFYAAAQPGPEDVLLVVEVAETSSDYDRQIKISLYARWGIPEAWLVDLDQHRVEVYRDPSPDGYRDVRVVTSSEPLAPLTFPDLDLRAQDVLGP
jgi:Uma2 family endonuclease